MIGWTLGIIVLIAGVTLGKIISLLRKKHRAERSSVSSAASRGASARSASVRHTAAPAAGSASGGHTAAPSARSASGGYTAASSARSVSDGHTAADHSGSSASSAVRAALDDTDRNDTETGPMVYFANDKHRGKDREYRFNYKFVNGSWRAYILRTPGFGKRDQSGTVTHRLYDHGRPYVCWDTKIETLREMQTVSKLWADCIQEYIATGKKFG
ncbi:MAG: hypothetical protein Q4C61_06560 [Lachnospiraceae bacterium]|nr:hypothetical protein [Lachnospiraceae bacterium]